MTRNKLIAFTNLACFKARTTDEDRAALVAAVADPDIHEVLVGNFGYNGQACPLTLAGFFPPPADVPAGSAREESHDRFWQAFDALMNTSRPDYQPSVGGYVVEIVG